MQPYLFPYIGYFQLMRAVDVFIFHDDVQYIKGGWINRNRILVNGKVAWLTLPVENDSYAKHINRRFYAIGPDTLGRIERRLAAAYRLAPFIEELPEIMDTLDCMQTNVATCNQYQLQIIARRLGITCNFVVASDIDEGTDLQSASKVIDLCKRLKATHYINPIGGTSLYNHKQFADAGIALSFIKTAMPSERQYSIVHEWLSFGLPNVADHLNEYALL